MRKAFYIVCSVDCGNIRTERFVFGSKGEAADWITYQRTQRGDSTRYRIYKCHMCKE